MAKVLVLGNINVETTVPIAGFPIEYAPVHYYRNQLSSSVSAVGFNVAKALHTLGNEVRLMGVTGDDLAAGQIRSALQRLGLSDQYLLPLASGTPQSVILFDQTGRRQIHTDLKDAPEQSIPWEIFEEAINGCDAAVMTNIQYSKPLLEVAKSLGVPIITDVQTIQDAEDEYNQPFIQTSDILFLSDERLHRPAEEIADNLFSKGRADTVIIGHGRQGAMLCTRSPRQSILLPAVPNPNIRSTGGAGDALCASFTHAKLNGSPTTEALEQAILFASHTLGFASSSEGFLDDASLQARYEAWRQSKTSI